MEIVNQYLANWKEVKWIFTNLDFETLFIFFFLTICQIILFIKFGTDFCFWIFSFYFFSWLPINNSFMAILLNWINFAKNF